MIESGDRIGGTGWPPNWPTRPTSDTPNNHADLGRQALILDHGEIYDKLPWVCDPPLKALGNQALR